jgi:hypothetical protein
VAFILVPFVWPVIYLVLDNDASERAERLLNLWPLVLILSVFAIVAVIRRRSVADLIVPSIVIATVHGAFLSQQLWGSTYALWPMFVILIAFVISALCGGGCSTVSESSSDISQAVPNGPVTISAFVLASVISICLLIAGAFYVRSHERLDYADLDDGDLAHSTNPALKGMATRGSWLTDFDELVAYADKEIPRADGILCLPGEDLFYYTTGRQPQFPVVMFDHTVNPYSPQEIVDIARERNINWLIVKNDLQLEGEPIEGKDELMNLLMQQFESVDSLNNYEIYKRMSADEDDGDDDDKAPQLQKASGSNFSRVQNAPAHKCDAGALVQPFTVRVLLTSDLGCQMESLLHGSQQPLLVWNGDIVPLVYLRAVRGVTTFHVERLAAVARHDPYVTAADVGDGPLLGSRAVLVPLPHGNTVVESAPLHVEHLATMACDDLVVTAADRHDLPLLVGPSPAGVLLHERTGRGRSAFDIQTLTRVPGDDLVIRRLRRTGDRSGARVKLSRG